MQKVLLDEVHWIEIVRVVLFLFHIVISENEISQRKERDRERDDVACLKKKTRGCFWWCMYANEHLVYVRHVRIFFFCEGREKYITQPASSLTSCKIWLQLFSNQISEICSQRALLASQ